MLPRRTHDELLCIWWTRTEQRGPDECWPWAGAINDSGYGTFGLVGNDISVMAHRFGYFLLVGPVPKHLHLDHICHNADPSCTGGASCLHRRCVNPAHLEPVTTRENTNRSPIRQRQSAAKAARLAARVDKRRVYTDEERQPVPGIPHGRPGSYTNHRCRCDECRAAWSIYLCERRAARGRSDRKRKAA